MQIELYLDEMPMTKYQTCFCCHTVRGCKDCCNTCTNECNNKHDCELAKKPTTTWLNSILTVFAKEHWIYPSRRNKI